MNAVCAGLFACAALLMASPAEAAEDSKVDMAKLTCKQFTAYNDDNRGLMMMARGLLHGG
jgi:HdeA/HdeB family